MAWYWWVLAYVVLVVLFVWGWSRFMGGLRAQDRRLWDEDAE